MVLDAARRQADYFGPEGMKAKAGQHDDVIRRNGKLRLRFLSRKLAEACEERINELRLELDTDILPKRKSAASKGQSIGARSGKGVGSGQRPHTRH